MASLAVAAIPVLLLAQGERVLHVFLTLYLGLLIAAFGRAMRGTLAWRRLGRR